MCRDTSKKFDCQFVNPCTLQFLFQVEIDLNMLNLMHWVISCCKFQNFSFSWA